MTSRVYGGVARWLTEAVPRGRIAAFRTLIYLFVAGDVVWFTPWVRSHADVPGELYHPLFIGRLLPLPTPTPLLVHGIFWALLVLGLAAATGRLPRLLGWTVFVLYFEWMIIAMSYGKVDHDRFAFLVALAVLPTAGAARHGVAVVDRTRRMGAAGHPDRRRVHVLPRLVGEAALRRHRVDDGVGAGAGDPAAGYGVRRPDRGRCRAC